MKPSLKKWSIRLLSLALISILTIVLSVFNPSTLYAHKTEIGSYTIFHSAALPTEFEQRLTKVHAQIKESELFDEALTFRVCLNDGSLYPEMMEKLRGRAFGWGFHNITTYRGEFNFAENTVELNGYKWNLEQLIAHELTHCLQFLELGFLNSNPIGNHPHWKWEGYAEYVSRKSEEQLSLVRNIQRMEAAKQETPGAWGIFFEDGTVAPRTYYEAWLLVQYCLEIKK